MNYVPESCKPETIRRRLECGIYDGMAQRGPVLDVGCGRVPGVNYKWWEFVETAGGPRVNVTPWDLEDGDATYLVGVAPYTYGTVYASHILEHLRQPGAALMTWLNTVPVSGVVFAAVPHRDLYEQKTRLPSTRNPKHLRYYMPDRYDAPDTVGVLEWLTFLRRSSAFPSFEIESLQVCGRGYRSGPRHPSGEYSIEFALRRLP